MIVDIYIYIYISSCSIDTQNVAKRNPGFSPMFSVRNARSLRKIIRNQWDREDEPGFCRMQTWLDRTEQWLKLRSLVELDHVGFFFFCFFSFGLGRVDLSRPMLQEPFAYLWVLGGK